LPIENISYRHEEREFALKKTSRIKTTRARATTKDNEVYLSLREGILRNDFHPGEALREEELCRQMNITRTPLRLALRRLEQEQLIIGEPYRGCRVRGVTRDELEPLFDIREVLEGLAARNVTTKGSRSGLATLRSLASGCDAAASAEQWPSFFQQDKNFHRELIQQSGNAKLAEVMEVYDFQLRTFLLHHRYLLYVVAQLTEQAGELKHNHEKLVGVLESGDAGEAERQFRQHVRRSKVIVLNAWHLSRQVPAPSLRQA
jgi:DNA-binding GntR family transcriptional regulator